MNRDNVELSSSLCYSWGGDAKSSPGDFSSDSSIEAEIPISLALTQFIVYLYALNLET